MRADGPFRCYALSRDTNQHTQTASDRAICFTRAESYRSRQMQSAQASSPATGDLATNDSRWKRSKPSSA